MTTTVGQGRGDDVSDKRCSHCGLTKPLDEFYADRRTRSGRQSHCKGCFSAYWQTASGREAIKRHNASPRAAVARSRYNRSVRGRLWRTRWAEKNPQKRHCHQAVFRALTKGRINRQPCKICGARTVEAHHDDYSKPLVVTWLCAFHHQKHHQRKEGVPA